MYQKNNNQIIKQYIFTKLYRSSWCNSSKRYHV